MVTAIKTAIPSTAAGSKLSKPPGDRYTLVKAPTVSKASVDKAQALIVKHESEVQRLRNRLTEVLVTQEAERQVVSDQLHQQRSQLQIQQQAHLQQLTSGVDAVKDQLAQQSATHQQRVRAFLDARQQRLRDARTLLQQTAAERSQQLHDRHLLETGQLTRRYAAMTTASDGMQEKSTAHLKEAHEYQLQESEKQYTEQHQQQAAIINTLRQQLQSVHQMVEQQSQHLHTLQQRLTRRQDTLTYVQNKQQQLQRKCNAKQHVHDQAVAVEKQCINAEEQLQYQQSKNYILQSEYQKLEAERNSIRLSFIRQIEAIKLRNQSMNETLEGTVVDILQRIPENGDARPNQSDNSRMRDTASSESDFSGSETDGSYTEDSCTQSSAEESYSQSFAGD